MPPVQSMADCSCRVQGMRGLELQFQPGSIMLLAWGGGGLTTFLCCLGTDKFLEERLTLWVPGPNHRAI